MKTRPRILPLDVLFDRKALRQRKERLRQLVSGEIFGKATQEAIASTEAALAVIIMMPVMISSFNTGSHSH